MEYVYAFYNIIGWFGLIILVLALIGMLTTQGSK